MLPTREWLVDIRKEKKIPVEDIITNVGITRQAYWMIESGLRRPSVDTAMKIGELLGFDWTLFYEKK